MPDLASYIDQWGRIPFLLLNSYITKGKYRSANKKGNHLIFK